MADAGGPGGRSGAGHRAFLYRSEQELLAEAVPFLREGIIAEAPVLVVLDSRKQELLRGALAGDATRVEWADPTTWYTFGPHALRRAHEFACRTPGRSTRLLGEVVWAGRSAAEVTEWARYESLLTVAFPDTPVLCAYDATALDEAVLATAGHTHPVLHGVSAQARVRATYIDPPAFLTACDASVLPAPPGTARALGFGPADLRRVRRFVAARAAAVGLDADRGEDLVTAVTEAATNAVEHGGGHGSLWIWTSTDRIVCEVTNAGEPLYDPLAGQLPPDPRGPRGRGLWLMRQLADLVELRSSNGVTTVRIHMWI